MANLMLISGAYKDIPQAVAHQSQIEEETKYIDDFMQNLKPNQVVEMSECVVYYEAWQLNCCGEPFSVGDEVEWRCIVPMRYKNVHGVLLDFEEKHHGESSLLVKGKISRILAEKLEFPKNMRKSRREFVYHKVPATHDEIQHACRMKESETVAPTTEDSATVKVLWGYIIELDDVTATPVRKR